MTETQATDGRVQAVSARDAADVTFPDGRYGRRRAPRRRRPAVTVVLTVAVVAAGLVAAWRLSELYGQNDVSERLLGFDDSVPGQVTVEFEVYKPAGEGAVCAVRSRDLAGAEIGYAEVEIPADDATHVEVAYALAVEGQPNTGEVLRCRQAD
ncbi:DUF4307 domain-containing protein [Glycomyces sp. TRM65418]|uniref:DUF4307 domain-containing protein n=1 Tax=Glycomyces sp. TRM65418 TaxID=2867006 RepID=UPI001CE6F156|nr:DUF4307 domain-containing protein [Glycomyces sp. TRM65418]MCC3765737.1 DUF4307 domain-containing protein [Glycomyces sp. TRM65418]QZD55329.1 DUF4307 domain-containing protein [Glycomyces sp. TRM65418]